MTSLLLLLLCSMCVLCLTHPISNSSCNFTQTTEDGRTVIPVGVLAAMGAESPDTTDVFPAVQLAMETINNRSDVLPGYSLEPCFKASECSWRPALSNLFDVIGPSLEDPTQTRPLFIIGSGCSPRTQPISQVNQFMNMFTLSYYSSSPTLANSSLFPSFFRLEFNEAIRHFAQVSFIERLNYTNQRVGVFLQDITLFTASWTEMRLKMMHSGIHPTLVRFSETTLRDRLSDLFDDPPAMFIVNAYESQARIIFCEALERGLVYPRFGWVFIGWYGNQWWDNERFSSNCATDKLERFLPFTITVETEARPDNFSMATDVELTPTQFRLKYEEFFNRSSKLNHTLTSADRLAVRNRNAYDTTWALAFGLNASLEELASMNLSLADYDHFSPSSEVIVGVVRRHFSTLDFTGVSGRVAFNFSGDRVAHPTTVSQFRMVDGSLTSAEIGQIVDTEFVPNATLTWEDIFPDGIPRRQTVTTSLGLFIPLVVVSVLAAILSVFFIIFTIVYRNRRVVKAASPILNIISAVGSLVLYFMVIMLTFPSESPLVHTVVKCSMVVWLSFLGEILVFAPLLLKSWRVYRIYHHPSVNGKVVSNWKLLLILAAILSGGVVLLVIITAVPQLRREAREELVNDELRILCKVPDDGITFAVPFLVLVVYFGLLLVLGLFFAFQTRNVKIKALIESRQIASAILVEALLISLVYPVVSIVILPVDVANGFSGFVLITKNVLVMCLLFLPKVYFVWVKKKTDSDSTEVWTSEELEGLHRATLASMQTEIDQLKSDLDSYKSIVSNMHSDGHNDGRSHQLITTATLSHDQSHDQSHKKSYDLSHDLVYHNSEVLIDDCPSHLRVHRKTWSGAKGAGQYQLVGAGLSETVKN